MRYLIWFLLLAFPSFQKCEARPPGYDSWAFIDGSILGNLLLYDKAIEKFTQAIEEDPSFGLDVIAFCTPERHQPFPSKMRFRGSITWLSPYGLRFSCLRLTQFVTSLNSRLGTEWVGTPFLIALSATS